MTVAIAVLISGNGSNLQAIIEAIPRDNINARIEVVISDQLAAKGLQRAQHVNISTAFIDPSEYQSRAEFDTALQGLLDEYAVQLIVLAGFMRILTDKFVLHYSGRLINIHPSLLPKYRGLNTHQRVLDEGEKYHGASVHFVVPELDAGPIILQQSVEVTAQDTRDSLQNKVHQIEHIIYPRVIHWFTAGRLSLENNIVLLDEHKINNNHN